MPDKQNDSTKLCREEVTILRHGDDDDTVVLYANTLRLNFIVLGPFNNSVNLLTCVSTSLCSYSFVIRT